MARKSEAPSRRRSTRRPAEGVEPAAPAPAPPGRAGAARTALALQDQAVEQALRTGDQPGLLEDLFGPAGHAELRALAREAAARTVRSGERVLILPGIMGSKLGYPEAVGPFDDVIWVDPVDIAVGRLRELKLDAGASPGRVRALGVLLFAYLALKLRLRIAGHDAQFFPFDWRLGLGALGRLLGETLAADGRPTQLVAHSMGGLVARAALAERPANLRQVITLGTPNFGSYSPVQAFRGVHSIVRKVAFIDLSDNQTELAGIFGTFPGLIEMMPSPRLRPVDFFDPRSWPMAGARPADAMLAAARAAQAALPEPDERFVLIVGTGTETVVGAQLQGEEFAYDLGPDGDGTVPLDLARVSGRPAYVTRAEHGGMPNDADLARAVDDILASGRTSVLPELDPASTRGRVAVTRTVRDAELAVRRPYEGAPGRPLSAREQRRLVEEVAAPPGPEPPEGLAAAPAAAAGATAAAEEPALVQGLVVGRRRQQRLDIELVQGSIADVRADALVVGLFRNVAPGGAARALDLELGGALSELVARRMFGGNVGEVSSIPARRHRLGTDVVMLAGLGSIDAYQDETLEAVGENVMRTALLARLDDFAIVPVGAASGSTPASALRHLLAGFLRGLRDAGAEGHLRGITVCETDPNRFRELRIAFRQMLTTSLFGEIEVTLSEGKLPLPAALPVPARGATPAPGTPQAVYLLVRQEVDERGAPSAVASVLTAGGKAAIYRGRQPFAARAVEEITASLAREGLPAAEAPVLGRRIAELVLEPGICEILARETAPPGNGMPARPLVVVHDAPMSRIPWETLHLGDAVPALAGGLTHRYDGGLLSVAKWREERSRTPGLDMLLVVNPTEDLPGAEEEGARIEGLFGRRPGIRLTVLHGRKARRRELLGCFSSGRFDVVHYAGHAFFDPAHRARSGIVCHGGEVLSGADLAGLAQLPALVFFNACEAARVRRPGQAQRPGEDTVVQGTVGFAEAFLMGGVANYLGTYWPVGDDSARAFAAAFYGALLDGERLGGALLQGRRAVLDTGSGDWADYVLYGDSEFMLKSAA